MTENASDNSQKGFFYHHEWLVALAKRALYWPAKKALIISDLHLGKEDIFRKKGIALPSGTSRENFQRLSELLEQLEVTDLWITGDLTHGKPGETAKTLWSEWRQLHQHLSVHIIRGNHDHLLDEFIDDNTSVMERFESDNFIFNHLPLDSAEKPVICGHIHPVIRLPGIQIRCPVFVISKKHIILPAFSAFTGGVEIKPSANQRILVCARNILIYVNHAANKSFRSSF